MKNEKKLKFHLSFSQLQIAHDLPQVSVSRYDDSHLRFAVIKPKFQYAGEQIGINKNTTY